MTSVTLQTPKRSRRNFLARSILAPTLAFPVLSGLANSTNGPQPKAGEGRKLDELLPGIRAKHGLPALAAGVMSNGDLLALGAAGFRKMGEETEVTQNDKFHIGSCTKAMTATLAAMAVERGILNWMTTLADVFPERAGKMHQHYREVTLQQLLTHRSGAPANGTTYGPKDASLREQRLAYMDAVLAKSPIAAPGARFEYSNAGYIIAGAMLERVNDRPWEELIRRDLFAPLGMATAGFGPPSRRDAVDQPWGHVFSDGKFRPRYGDNPPALGPAGTVHCSLSDYLKFADFHASGGTRPEGILRQASIEYLQRPYADQEYACGWGVVQRSWARGTALTHNGSNTMNYFTVWVAPKLGLSLAIASNSAGNKVPEVVDEVASALVKRFALP